MWKKAFVSKTIFSALEIEGGYIKFAQAEDSPWERKITKLIVKKLTIQSEKELIANLKDIIDEAKGELGHLTICIPRHKVTVRFLSFPSLNEKEIAGMVKLQSVKELPYPKEEINSDYLITEQTKNGYTKVALAIVHQNVVEHYLTLLKAAGLEAQRITFSTEAILDWQHLALGQKPLSGCALLIDLDTDNADLAVFYNSSLDFTRGLAWGTAHLQEDANLKDKLVREIRDTISGYSRQEKARRVEKLFLTQAGKITGELKSFLSGELLLPCEIIVPLKNLPCEKEVSDIQAQNGVSLFRVLGAVLATKRLNLLPLALREKQEFKLRRKRIWRISLLLLVMVCLSLAIFAKKIHDKRLRLIYLDKEIRRTAPAAEEVENIFKKIELIQTRRQITGSSIDALRQLHQLASGGIALSSFSYDEENKTATLLGVSTNMPEIFAFTDVLEKSPYFKNVQLKYVSEKKAKTAGDIDFKIECNLE